MLLAVSHLAVSYGNRTALSDVSFQLKEGEVVALLGPNGSGKSTLLRALLGQHAATGDIQWQNQPLADWPRRKLAQQAAYLAQLPAWEPGQIVAETLRLGRAPYLRPFGIESERDLQIVQQVSHQLGLDDLLERPLENLSGGQRQRVFIGRCLVQEPRALLLDEPNTHLDLRHQVELGKLLASLAREQNLGILMASHDLNLAGAFADRVLLLADGKLVAAGPPAEVLQPSILEPVYGVPLLRVDSPPGATALIVPNLK
jgi:iron complex transport system ATP-binding protein